MEIDWRDSHEGSHPCKILEAVQSQAHQAHLRWRKWEVQPAGSHHHPCWHAVELSSSEAREGLRSEDFGWARHASRRRIAPPSQPFPSARGAHSQIRPQHTGASLWLHILVEGSARHCANTSTTSSSFLMNILFLANKKIYREFDSKK